MLLTNLTGPADSIVHIADVFAIFSTGANNGTILAAVRTGIWVLVAWNQIISCDATPVDSIHKAEIGILFDANIAPDDVGQTSKTNLLQVEHFVDYKGVVV